MMPTTAIPSATIILMVHCMMLLRMVSPHPSGAALVVLTYNRRDPSNKPVTYFIGAQSFLSAPPLQSRIVGCA
jgi:hypothetical protein